MAAPYDWTALKGRWEAHAVALGKDPRELTRDELKRVPGFGNCFNTRASDKARGAMVFREAKATLFPEPVPQPVHPRGHRVRGVSSLIDSEGNLKAQWIKTDREKEQREEALKRILEELPALLPVRETVSAEPPRHASSDLLAIYPQGDPHCGEMAWREDAGDDFDLAIFERFQLRAAHYLASQGGRTKRAVLVSLGDYFHANNAKNRTPQSGHQLDVDSRYAKQIRVGVRTMICTIEALLAHHETVGVICQGGNHDPESSLWLSVAIDAYYHSEPRVTVDLSPAAFHYLRHGKCLIGVTHGDKTKPQDLEGIMAHDRAKDWSSTEHRMWLTGHIHHKTVHEFRSCTVESFRTMAARDHYAESHGYRSRRDAQKILLHAEHGEVARFVADYRFLQALEGEAA